MAKAAWARCLVTISAVLTLNQKPDPELFRVLPVQLSVSDPWVGLYDELHRQHCTDNAR